MSSRFTRVYPPNPATTRGTSTKIGTHGDKIIYANGRCIIIRDLKDSANDVVYSQHISSTTVARFSPSGYYAASADVQGNVRIWDTAGTDQILKSEFKVLSGRINDLSWDGESKRIIAVGDGRDKFGHVFQFDTGSSAGEIAGHTKAINAVAIRNQRPFRAATAGDDGTIAFFTGAPYKYQTALKSHTNFVHTLAYAPSGSHFVSGSADHRVILWDGTSGDVIKELVDGKTAHTGTIFGAAWSPDSKSIVTSSGDCTIKLWDIETAKPTTSWQAGNGVENHQIGNTWTGSNLIISLNLAGVLNIFDPRTGEKPVRVIKAPVKSVTSATLLEQPPSFVVGSSDGRIHTLSLDESSITDPKQSLAHVTGAGPTSLVVDMANHQQSVWSVSIDDKLREISVGPEAAAATFSPSVYSLSSQPQAIATSSDGHIFVAGVSSVEVLRGTQKVTSLSLKFNCLALDVANGDSNLVAVGGEDSRVHLYKWNVDGTLSESGELPEAQKGPVTAVAFSPNGELLAAGDSGGKIVVYDMKERKVLHSRWTHHSSRIYSLTWTTDGTHIASASLDTHIYVWDVAKPMKIIAVKNAIPGGAWRVAWVPRSIANGKGKLLGSGADGAVRVWEIMFH